MKFSELWLREWVNPAIDSAALSEQLTMAGLEVDDVIPVAGTFHGVVVGEVMQCMQHPNADKLRVTKVDVGGDRLLGIVCGAANCRQGLKVAVATVGAVLPGDFKIKAAKLRGEPSEGMLCSFSELGIDVEQNGIIELPAEASTGQDVRDYLQLDDVMIEISVTPNRADCLGMVGVARDISAVNKLPLTEPDIAPVAATHQACVPIKVEAAAACPRYLARVVKGIDLRAETPLWMKEKLRRGGIRSIDAVVDITNFVLLELGQPMHAFDLDRINGGIVVRHAAQDEVITLLDGSEVKLSNDVLVIADHEKALALAGIFGGAESGVREETVNVLLECAYFDPLAIAGRARRFGLHTDASHRYERGVDPEIQYKAISRATQLLLDICGGEAGPVVEATDNQMLPQSAKIILQREKLDRLIGHFIADEEVNDILVRLGCKVSLLASGKWQVLAPSWRFDLRIEEDLVEEVARIYGYNNIPNIPVKSDLVMTRHREADLSLQRVQTLLVDRGYQEAITYSFVDPKVQQLLHPGEESLLLPNPISVDMSAMRLSLWRGLLSAVIYNQNRQQPRVRLFESGLRFVPDTAAECGVRQEMLLAGVIAGPRNEEHWDLARENVDYYDLKGDVEALLELTGKNHQWSFQVGEHPALHPGQTAAIYLGSVRVGYLGVVHPELERKLDLNGRTVLFELEWQKVAERMLPDAVEVSRFPANRRDIAVVVAESVPAADVINECKKVGVNQIVGVNLFDVYRGKGIEPGFKSLAISLTLQDASRTLEEEEIASAVMQCVEALKERFQASLRD
ncbi:MAG: Phenylalanine--tRNA ligase beta subunit [Candidatus Erwinia impunctatus]|nr:Phenylalanine--tRNA ligase beta subunit [Culicoides impunctatus]